MWQENNLNVIRHEAASFSGANKHLVLFSYQKAKQWRASCVGGSHHIT